MGRGRTRLIVPVREADFLYFNAGLMPNNTFRHTANVCGDERNGSVGPLRTSHFDQRYPHPEGDPRG
jgi:hypothetical protein